MDFEEYMQVQIRLHITVGRDHISLAQGGSQIIIPKSSVKELIHTLEEALKDGN